MFFGTDLALERQRIMGDVPGIHTREYKQGDAVISETDIETDEAAAAIGKRAGRYITVTVPSMTATRSLFDGRVRAIADSLGTLLPDSGTVLFAGLGNMGITSDSFGPLAAKKILATNHLEPSFLRFAGFGELRRVCVIAPGVAGSTGMEASDTVMSICGRLKPAAVIAADALAAGDLARVGRTFQLTDTGISPGSGVKNNRRELNRETVGVPVIAIGVPTVINAVRAAECIFGRSFDGKTPADYADTIVTVREADAMVGRAATMVAAAVNLALHPSLSLDELTELTSE